MKLSPQNMTALNSHSPSINNNTLTHLQSWVWQRWPETRVVSQYYICLYFSFISTDLETRENKQHGPLGMTFHLSTLTREVLQGMTFHLSTLTDQGGTAGNDLSPVNCLTREVLQGMTFHLSTLSDQGGTAGRSQLFLLIRLFLLFMSLNTH